MEENLCKLVKDIKDIQNSIGTCHMEVNLYILDLQLTGKVFFKTSVEKHLVKTNCYQGSLQIYNSFQGAEQRIYRYCFNYYEQIHSS